MSTALAATDPSNAVLAIGLFDKAQEITSDGKLLLQSAAGCLVLFFVLKNLMASFTVARLIISALIGGAALWVVFNMDVLKDSTGEELESAPAVVHIVAEPSSGLDLPV